MIIDTIQRLVDSVLSGAQLSREDVRVITELAPGEEPALFWGADTIRRHFRGNAGQTCAIMNARCGACSEDCVYCAQAEKYNTDVTTYPMPGEEELIQAARVSQERGAKRFSFVTSGRGLGSVDIDRLCRVIRRLPDEGVDIPICLSLGILDKDTFFKLKDAGAVRYHHNLETSRRHFSQVTTTHTYQDRVDTVALALDAGFEVCSGVLLGLEESWEDRIDLALEIRRLGVHSIPINFLAPISGTPAADFSPLAPLEALRSIALFRFLNPSKEIRICGGREYCLGDLQSLLFYAGADGIMIGNYLVVEGRNFEEDLQMMQAIGIEI